MSCPILTVFISDHCPSCADAKDIAGQIRERYPGVRVETCNIDRETPRPEVFAVPTYMLDDRVVFLGNPTDDQIARLLGDYDEEQDRASTSDGIMRA